MSAPTRRSVRHGQDALTLHDLADNAASAATSAALRSAADLAEREANRERRRESHDVITLPASAFPTQVADSRRRSAVRHGDDTYLPTWYDHQELLPMLLMTGGLFGAGAFAPAESSTWRTVAECFGARLGYAGPRLNQGVLRVYTAALRALRDTPMADPDRPSQRTSKTLTFREFITKYYGVGYSAETHRHTRNYLRALSSGSMVLWASGFELPLPALLTTGFCVPPSDPRAAIGYINLADADLRGSDVLILSMPSSLAKLFSQNRFCRYAVRAVDDAHSKSLLWAGSQLDSWLALRNHSRLQARTESIRDLFDEANTGQTYDKFCESLTKALDRLKAKGLISAYAKTRGVRGQPGTVRIVMPHMRETVGA